MKKIYTVLFLGLSMNIVYASDFISYWNFNNNTNNEGVSAFSSTNNGVTFVTDRFGNESSAAHFDGESTILIHNFDNTSASEITYTFWVKLDDLASAASTVLQGSSHHALTIGHYLSADSLVPGSFFAGLDNTSLNNDISLDPTPADLIEDEWTFIAATNDGSMTRLYINGVLASEYSETLATNKGDLTIGNNTNTKRDVHMKGAIDDLKVYDRAIEAEEMLNQYTFEVSQNYNDLIACWEFENSILDKSKNNFQSTNNGVTFVTDRFGNESSAAHFDGSSTILVHDFDNTSVSEITYTFWVKIDDLTSAASTVLQGKSHHALTIGHYISTDSLVPGSFFAGLDNTSLNNDISLDPTPADLIEDEWAFIAATNDGFTTRLYINGVLASEYSETLATNKGDLTIGNNTNSKRDVHMKGTIDDLKVYDRVLTAGELLQKSQLVISSNETIDNLENVVIYPNPSTGTFNLNFNENHQAGEIEIRNLKGKLIHSMEFTTEQNLNFHLIAPPGIYIMTIMSGKKTTVLRLIKQ